METIERSQALGRPVIASSSRTFILPYVFQRKREAGILPLDNADFSEGASADNS